MCGIVGGVNVSWKKDPLQSIIHRGPDDKGWYEEDEISLGHVRLAIQDLSELGHQPMSASDGRYVIVFNGEIYNHWEIRKELENLGCNFKSTSDTETLLNAWVKWGKDCIEKLNGIYAFAILDRKKSELTLMRDPVGIKPLYLYKSDTGIAFSSELKSFRCIEDYNFTIDPKGILNYLTFLWSPGTQTITKEVVKVLPGNMIRIDARTGEINRVESFSKTPYKGCYKAQSEEDWIDELDGTLQKVVYDQLLSDVPVGFFLSGGLDSSLLVAIAKKLYPQEKFPCFTIRTTKLGKEEGFADDLPYAKKVADHLDLPIHVIDAEFDLFKELDNMIWHLDEPQADVAPLYVSHISRAAKDEFNIKVLISGAGGDDVFSGYRRHQALQLEKYISVLPLFLRRGIRSLIYSIKNKHSFIRRGRKLMKDWEKDKENRILGYFNWLPDYSISKNILSAELRRKVNDYNPYNYAEALWDSLPKEVSDLDRLLYLEQKTFLVDHNLNYTDKLSMKHGVEVRVPYVSSEMIQLSGQIPTSLKMRGTTTKYILKKVAERYLPSYVIYRPKTGFGAPLRSWITDKYDKQVRERLSHEHIERIGLFDSEVVQNIILANKRGEEDYSYTILAMIACQSWYDQFTP